MFHTLLDLPCLSAALCTSWATKGTVCHSVLFYQHTDLRLIIHRTFTQVGNPSQSEGSSSIMGYDGNKALALFSRTQRGNNRVKCLAHEHNLQVLQQRSS